MKPCEQVKHAQACSSIAMAAIAIDNLEGNRYSLPVGRRLRHRCVLPVRAAPLSEKEQTGEPAAIEVEAKPG